MSPRARQRSRARPAASQGAARRAGQGPANDLLIELGTEELPATYLPALIAQLGEQAKALLGARHLLPRRIECVGTPRRLALAVRGLPVTQRSPAEEIRGPSKDTAFDPRGKPTPALRGFLRARHGTLRRVQVGASPRGDYVYLVKPPVTAPTTTLLPSLVTELIAALQAPKTMRWDASGARFPRPIRWLLVLYGTTRIRCTVGQVRSAGATQVGGPRRPRSVPVRSPEAYWRTLKRYRVLADQTARRARIRALVDRIARRSRGRAAAETVSHGLLDEVTHLVEDPIAIQGTFDRKYLELPREVLLASMAKYQRVFAIESKGALLPKFVAVLDGRPRRLTEVRKTMERILNARLADSLLFWKQDQEHLPLDALGARLTQVVFHEQLGSLADKTRRLRALSEPLMEAWRLTDEERAQLRRACALAKADLVSLMVREFPTLQGTIGRHYARLSGEPDAVGQAIEEQYLPAGDRHPQTLIGRAVSILDRYDLLTSYFALGIEPSGDEDPFGLRRAAQGLVEVAWAVQRPLPLDQLLRVRGTLEPFRHAQPKEIALVGQRVQRYLLDRLPGFRWPPPAPSGDVIQAVLAGPCDDLVDVMQRIRSLQQLHDHPGLLKAAKVVERTRNILKGAALRQPRVDPAQLREPSEQRLWELYTTHEGPVRQLIDEQSYGEATTRFGDVFFEPLHEFFEKVLVNVQDETLQQNRLALMKVINTLYTGTIADLSRLAVLQGERTP